MSNTTNSEMENENTKISTDCMKGNVPSSSEIFSVKGNSNSDAPKELSNLTLFETKEDIHFDDPKHIYELKKDFLSHLSEDVTPGLSHNKEASTGSESSQNNRFGVIPSSTDSRNFDSLNLYQPKKQKQMKIPPKILGGVQTQISQQHTPFMKHEANSTGCDHAYEQLLSQHCRKDYSTCDTIKSKNTSKPRVHMTTKITLKTPEICILSQKTVYSNIISVCQSLHRTPKHIASYILADLGSSGYVDRNHSLIIRARVSRQQIEKALHRYVSDYVRCRTCKTFNTFIKKRMQNYFLRCENCLSERFLSKIKPRSGAVSSKEETNKIKLKSSLLFIFMYIIYFYLFLFPLHHLFIRSNIQIPFSAADFYKF